MFITDRQQFLDWFYTRFLSIQTFYRKLLKEKLIKYDRRTHTYVRNVMGNVIHLNPRDGGISRVLARDGIREKESVDALFCYVTRDMTILDLGANIGFYVILEAKIVSKGNGQVVAIEPEVENLRLLKLNVRANSYENCVDVYEGAICDHTGTEQLQLSTLSNCHRIASVYSTTNEQESARYVDVPCYSFHDFMSLAGVQGEQLDFLRMDVEGSEYDIIPTIYDFLEKKNTFLMFIEFHPHCNRKKHIEVLKKLERIGFKCLTATKEYPSNNCIERKHRPNTSMNQLYEDEFFMQVGGCEVFLGKNIKS